MIRLLFVTVVLATASYRTAAAAQLIVDFEELPFAEADYYNGADLAGGFISRGVHFNNHFTDFGGGCCWNGWAYSRATDATTPGSGNQYSAWPGMGDQGSTAYGVAFSGYDAGGGLIPQITLPSGVEPVQIAIANTTYAALSMQRGDGFAKQFGGDAGNDPDWLKLTIAGLDDGGVAVAATSIYLADYRPADPADDAILAEWTEVDLSPLSGLDVATLAFRLESTDTSSLGMNTPAYFAADNLVLNAPSLPGDFDEDGQVDAEDLAHWQHTFGDATGADLIAWQRAWQPTTATLNVVPEPPAVVLIAGILFVRRLRPQRSVVGCRFSAAEVARRCCRGTDLEP